MEPRFPTLQADSLPAGLLGTPKNTGVGSLSLLQGIFLTQKSNHGLLHCRWIFYQLSYQDAHKVKLKDLLLARSLLCRGHVHNGRVGVRCSSGSPKLLVHKLDFSFTHMRAPRGEWATPLFQSVSVCAKSLQLCPTLCDHMDYSPPGSSVHGLLQARILEWVAVPFF